MQKIKSEMLIEKARELIENGTVSLVLGWEKGELGYDVSPGIYESIEEIEEKFVYNDFSSANLSKYLVKKTEERQAQLRVLGKSERKILIFLKPCDTYSFNQLVTEHRVDREKVYVVGVQCDGMVDVEKIKKIAGDGILSIDCSGEDVVVNTLYNGEVTIPKADVLAERCANCKSKKHVAYDELLGETGEVIDSNRFDEVEKLEKMTADERFAFWQNELSKCIRCNACRDACPACT